MSPFSQRSRLPCAKCGAELRYGDQWRPTVTRHRCQEVCSARTARCIVCAKRAHFRTCRLDRCAA
eukprot:2015342-Alexandrium_andersonii.AAC.1